MIWFGTGRVIGGWSEVNWPFPPLPATEQKKGIWMLLVAMLSNSLHLQMRCSSLLLVLIQFHISVSNLDIRRAMVREKERREEKIRVSSITCLLFWLGGIDSARTEWDLWLIAIRHKMGIWNGMRVGRRCEKKAGEIQRLRVEIAIKAWGRAASSPYCKMPCK